MAAPMRDHSLDGSHRTKVADPRGVTAAKAETTNFEYDDNEWDIGIGDLIIDLDADIEKTEKPTSEVATGGVGSMASATGKLSVEHSATVDKGLKMKIKRTKPGTKTSEAKHEIVKSNEQQNGTAGSGNGEKHGVTTNSVVPSANPGVKRGSSGHRRDKAKHEVNGVVRPPVQRVVFPVSVPGPGPPPNAPGPPPGDPVLHPPSPAPPPATPPAPALPAPPTLEDTPKPPASPQQAVPQGMSQSAPNSPTPAPKKPKLSACPSDISKEVVDVCVGTSVGTITEPDCLGPCEPGTSVTLEGIVWHETEGVLVVNVTWRGKTYVGTLLDCTRHDWAPPRFCDSPTSDLDARTPKGRGKRGRQATGSTTSNDLSNFTETRSSVHSKLRSNNNGGGKGRRNPGGPSSPTPFVPPKTDTTPGKRKPKAPEEETPAKKSKPPPPPPPVPTPTPTPVPTATVIPTVTPSSSSTSSSPPPSPVLLECPEPNCSKKYKHINGLKYHQSHAHSNADDEETKESAGSLSEAEEAPSPAPVVKKEGEPSPIEMPAPETPTSAPAEVPTPSPQPPPTTPTPTPEVDMSSSPSTPDKSVIKPGVLRFGTQEEALLTIPTVPPTTRPVQTTPSLQPSSPRQPSPIPSNPQTPIPLVVQQPQPQPPVVGPPHVVQIAQSLAQQNQPINAKVPQFKVKPTSVLMPDDKKVVKPPNHKKKNRKSPAGSPHPHPHLLEPQPLGLEPGGREDVQSPAYSDISDDGAPVLDPEVDASKVKPSVGDKKVEVNPGQSPHSMQHYNMYPYYGQPPYLVPSVTTDNKPKDNTSDKSLEAKPGLEKEKKEGNTVSGEFQQKMLPQHYYPYGYVPSYPYNLEPGYSVPMVADEKPTVIKEEKSPGPNENTKQNLPPAPTPLHVPNPNKIKTEPCLKEKHSNENHQILKESIEMKNQMSPAYLYSRSQQQQSQSVQQQEEMRRYYISYERRKELSNQPDNPSALKATPSPQPKQSVPVPSPKHKEKPSEDKKEEKIKQEGVKPTMETQGPPPPPTSSYAYIHPGYMQSPHYGAIPFDPGHSMYARGINPMIVPGPYSNNPYMHPQLHPPMPRYHAPEDLSRGPPTGPPKALDLLQHHASQYYTSHKIHELQERALKSPTPKATVASASPSSERGPSVGVVSGPQGTPTSATSTLPPTSGTKTTSADGKEPRSPPPQRHVHTHHHTHVGLGYPIITGQYPAPYGAAVIASTQQAAAVAASIVPPFSPK